MRKVLAVVHNISLKNKLVFLFLIVSLIPVLVIGTVSYNISSNIIKEREIIDRGHILNDVIDQVTAIIDDKQLAGVRFHLDKSIQQFLGKEGSLNPDDAKRFEVDVKKLLFHNKNSLGTNSIYLLSKAGTVYSYKKSEGVDMNNYENRQWFQESMQQGKVYFWGDVEQIGGEYVIPFVRVISSLETSETLGVLVINVQKSFIEGAFENYARQTPGFYWIVNQRNNVISSFNKDDCLGKNIIQDLGIAPENLVDSKGYFEEYINGQKYLFIYASDRKTGWKFFSVVPIGDILGASRHIKQITVFLSLFCIAICLLLSLYLSQRVTAPIQTLIENMQQAETGNWDLSLTPRYNDEIGKLTDSFSRMLSRLKESVEKTIAAEKEKRDAELKVLGFQINPHFLYNTLSSIIWLSNAEKTDDVIRLTKALSNFFRISISRGQEVIPIEDEINHIRNYLEIQRIRYRDEFDVIYEIDDEIREFYVPKLILQPLVENAIYHGIKNLDGIKGIIRIEGYRKGGIIYLVVKDNGNVLTEADVARINDFLANNVTADKSFGIGIRNVNDRLKLFFGQEYGLRFRKSDLYTVAEIRIPTATRPNDKILDNGQQDTV